MKKMISTKPVNQIDIINQLLKPFDARITIFSRTPQDSFIHFQELPKKPTNGDRTTISIGRTANNQLSYSNYQKNSLTVESLKRFREGTDYDTSWLFTSQKREGDNVLDWHQDGLSQMTPIHVSTMTLDFNAEDPDTSTVFEFTPTKVKEFDYDSLKMLGEEYFKKVRLFYDKAASKQSIIKEDFNDRTTLTIINGAERYIYEFEKQYLVDLRFNNSTGVHRVYNRGKGSLNRLALIQLSLKNALRL